MKLLSRSAFFQCQDGEIQGPSIWGQRKPLSPPGEQAANPPLARVQRAPVPPRGPAHITEGLNCSLGQNLYSEKEHAIVWRIPTNPPQ